MDTEKYLADFVSSSLAIEQININGLKINYASMGSGQDLLLIHGANMGWGQWYANIAELAKHFRVYAIDLPGAGSSSPINFPTANFQEDFVNIVEKFIKLKELKNFNIIGHSFGGWISLKLALKRLAGLKKIILVDSLGFTDYRPLKHFLIAFYPIAKLLSTTAVKPNKKNMLQFLTSVLYNKNSLHPSFVDYFQDVVSKEQKKHPFLFINRVTGVLAIDSELKLTSSQLSEIKNETLVLTGDKDPLIPYNKIAQNLKLLPNKKIYVFQDTGHVPPIEKSEIFNSLTLQFLLQD